MPARSLRPDLPRRMPRAGGAQTADARLTPAESIWQVVHAIPSGRVATYGEVAALAGLPRRARMVGRVLSQLPPDSRLPWHRVVAAGGRIVVRGGSETDQARRLRDEGVTVTCGRVDLRACTWRTAPAHD